MTLPRRLMPSLVTLQAFECAARHGSFTRAALELQLTQSAVSRQIKELESLLGVRLFERIRQRAVLSAAGKKFLPEVRQLLQDTEQTVIKAVARGEARDVLSLATLPTFGTRWLTPRLPDFLARYPETVMNVVSRSEPFDFAKEDFDAAIHFGQPVWANASCTFLCRETVVPVVNPSLLPEMQGFDPDRISWLPLLHLTTRPSLWVEWLSRHGASEVQAFQGHRFDQFAMLIAAAVGGMGVALLPLYMIEAELQSGRLVALPDMSLETENAYYVVIPDSKRDNPIAMKFLEWIIEEVSPHAVRGAFSATG